MITRTALAEKLKATVTAYAKTVKPNHDGNRGPHLKSALADAVYPLLAAAWAEGHGEAEAGIPAEFNPYK